MRERTVFIRLDNKIRDGRADVAHVLITAIVDGTEAYLGEISGREDVIDAEHVGYLTTEDPWDWVASVGYEKTISGEV